MGDIPEVWHQLTHKETGEKQVVGLLDGYDLDQFDVLVLERQPTAFEEPDETGALVTNELLQVNTRLGSEHVRDIWIIKYLEALMIVTLDAASIPVTKGLLFEEAKQRGITIKQMANQVLLKARTRLDNELERQRLNNLAPGD